MWTHKHQTIFDDLKTELISLKVISYYDRSLNSLIITDTSPVGIRAMPLDTGRKLNVHKTFGRRPGRLLNVLCTFNLRPVPRGILLQQSFDSSYRIIAYSSHTLTSIEQNYSQLE